MRGQFESLDEVIDTCFNICNECIALASQISYGIPPCIALVFGADATQGLPYAQNCRLMQMWVDFVKTHGESLLEWHLGL